jgi:uncharacterized OsmC-like protein
MISESGAARVCVCLQTLTQFSVFILSHLSHNFLSTMSQSRRLCSFVFMSSLLSFFASSFSKNGRTWLNRSPFLKQSKTLRQFVGSAEDDCSSTSSTTSTTSSSSSTIKTYKLQGTTSSTTKCGVTLTTNTGHVIETDLPRFMGGKDGAAQPVELLLSSLIGCTQATALFVGRNLTPRVDIRHMEFDIQAERDEEGALQLPVTQDPIVPSRLIRVSGTVTLIASKPIPSELVLDVLRHQTELRCPIANMMLASGIEMDIQWRDHTLL